MIPKDISHQACREFVKDKKCEFCEKIFKDSLNGTGFYAEFKGLPKFVFLEDIQEFGEDEAIRLAEEEYVNTAEGIARCQPVCRKHFKILRKDNDKRMKLGLDIPRSFELLRFRKSFI